MHTFLLTGSLYGRFAAMMAGVPIVIGTEVNIYENKRASHARFEKWLMRGTDAVIASAKSVKDFYVGQVGADPAKVDVIYNAVDWSQLETTMTPRRVPRLDWRAAGCDGGGHHRAADRAEGASRAVRRDGATGVAAATASRRGRAMATCASRCSSASATLGLQHRVHFVGARRDLGNILNAVDLFTMPSLWEGLPLSLVLAMGAGLPVVTTRVAGIPEVVQHDISGLLVAPGKSDELGHALTRLIEDRVITPFASATGRVRS